ncbi:hypothetical protein CPB86DRAFT_788856 [Serendipita vermifera]|nr:hypothetical protein CPB86DRAFT_788856 [Serendipita vermifera]
MSQHGGDDVEGRSPPRSPQIPYPGIRRANSQWSDQGGQQQQQQTAGGSYFPPPASQRRPAGSSRYPSNSNTATTARRSAVRSASLTSSRHGLPNRRRAGALSEEDEEAENADNLDDSNLSAGDEGEDETDDPVGEIATPRLRDVVADEDDPVTLKERQSLINDEHPFGLPIWKPALYRKSRTVTREAETALHGVPSASRDVLSLGNVLWTIFFGWWLSIVIIIPSLILSIIPFGGNKYAPVIYGLGWYLFWPFGRYVEGDIEPSPPESEEDEAVERPDTRSRTISGQSAASTVRGMQEAAGAPTGNSTIKATSPANAHTQSTSWTSANENTRLLPTRASTSSTQAKSYGALTTSHNYGVATQDDSNSKGRERFAKLCYYYFMVCNIAPLLLVVCAICWAFIFTIPMAKLTWELLKHMFLRPEHIRFCSAPKVQILAEEGDDVDQSPIQSIHPIVNAVPITEQEAGSRIGYLVKRAKLRAGQIAPSGKPNSTVLLCIYKAAGLQYYKYTVGGVNIIFINLIPIVFFAIFDGLVLMPIVERKEEHGEHVDPFLAFIASQALVFILSLASVIPLSYFIGMAVASISAQSSIGMGAVINATFGSIIEIILYAIALTQGKGRLVEGSIVGSILAGVLLMPGASMCSSALRRKEQGFNAKSASVTSTMLIMAIFGTLTPTLFYQIYGNFQLVCEGCPTISHGSKPHLDALAQITADPPWMCKRCYYQLPDPVTDPFYQETVKPLMYFCASILVLSYLIGLWFSLRTHASQIWQNPRQLMEPHPLDLPVGAGRMSLYHRLIRMPSGLPTHRNSESVPRRPDLRRRESAGTATTTGGSIRGVPATGGLPYSSSFNQGPIDGRAQAAAREHQEGHPTHITLPPPSPTLTRKVGGALPSGYTPLVEHVNQATRAAVDPMVLPPPTLAVDSSAPGQTRLNMTTEDFTRAVAVAAVSALREGADVVGGARLRASGATSGVYDSHHVAGGGGHGGHGGHDAPSWSRFTSASVLLSCTLLYAIIAEILVDVVDFVLKGSGIDEKFLGITLFALVPNTTEFMNAMSFALNGNISLSMEIGSAYALQVCLLQIPAMVAFSAWYDPRHMGTLADTFTLIFPRWDVIAIVLSIFLLTYTYIEAKSNYHRGSILILSYLVMASGFYFSPQDNDRDETVIGTLPLVVKAAEPYMHVVKTFAYSLFTH